MFEGFWIIYAIFWWVIAACCTVSVILYVFVCMEYWRWDRKEREREKVFTNYCHTKIEDTEHNEAKIIVDNDNSLE